MLEWYSPGDEIPMTINDVLYQGMQLNATVYDGSYNGIAVPVGCTGLYLNDPERIGSFNRRPNFLAYFFMPESAPLNERELEQMARSLVTGSRSETYNNLNCPKIHVSRDADMSWLIGLQFDNGLLVGSAFQQSQFKMDHNGVSAKSAVAISTLATCGPYSGTSRPLQVLELLI